MGGPQSPEVLCRTPTAPDRMVKWTRKASSAVMPRVRDVGQRGADPVELAEGAPDLVDDLGAVGRHPAAALVGVGPPRRAPRLPGRPAGGRGAAPWPSAARRSRRSWTAWASRAWPGVPAELAAEEVDDAGGLGRGQHGPTLGGVAGERLLADQVLAGGDGRQGDGRVGVGRRGDGDGVDPVEGQGVVDAR